MHSRCALTLPFVILIFGLQPSIAQAQARQSPQGPVPNRHSGKPLDDDPRLKIRVTIACKLETVARSLALLSKMTGISIQAPDGEIAATLISFRYNRVPLRDIFDSFSALRGWRWKLDSHNDWLLIPSAREVDALHPHSEIEAKLFRLGQAFLQEFALLPPDLRQAMWLDTASGGSVPGVLLDDLPPDVRTIVGSMIDASIIDQSEIGVPLTFSPKGKASLRVSLQGTRHADRDMYSVSVFTKDGSMTISDFQVMRDGSVDHTIMPREQDPRKARWQPAKEDAQSRRWAIQNDPCMKATISLNGEDVTLPEVMQELASLAGIAFAVDPQLGKSLRKTIHFVQMPLYEILDRLCTLYDFRIGSTRDSSSLFGYCWGRQESGAIVFHAASVASLADYRAMLAPR